MANLQEQVKDICRLADAVIQNPITPITTTAKNSPLKVKFLISLFFIIFFFCR